MKDIINMKEKYTENVVTNAITAKVCASVIKELRKYSKNNAISTEDMLKNSIKITNINKNSVYHTLTLDADLDKAGKKQYIINDSGVISQNADGSNRHVDKFTNGITLNFNNKFYNTLTPDKLDKFADNITNMVNTRFKKEQSAKLADENIQHKRKLRDMAQNTQYNVQFDDKKAQLNMYQFSAALLKALNVQLDHQVEQESPSLDPQSGWTLQETYDMNWLYDKKGNVITDNNNKRISMPSRWSMTGGDEWFENIGYPLEDQSTDNSLIRLENTVNVNPEDLYAGKTVRLHIPEPEHLTSIKNNNDLIMYCDAQLPQYNDIAKANSNSLHHENEADAKQSNEKLQHVEQLSLDLDGLDNNSKQL